MKLSLHTLLVEWIVECPKGVYVYGTYPESNRLICGSVTANFADIKTNEFVFALANEINLFSLEDFFFPLAIKGKEGGNPNGIYDKDKRVSYDIKD